MGVPPLFYIIFRNLLPVKNDAHPWGSPSLKNEAPSCKKQAPQLKCEEPFHEMIPRKRKSMINNNLKSS